MRTNQESRWRWEILADFWDHCMGEHSDQFYRTVIRPKTEGLLNVQVGDYILDIACGNGNFSKRLAELGATVVAFDYSEKMIEHAKKRCEQYLDQISFHVEDAVNYPKLLNINAFHQFDKAVSNMALMDISDIYPLLKAVFALLKPQGTFIFSTVHPCFTRPKNVYHTPGLYEGTSLPNQPIPNFYYHRSLQELFTQCFEAGFLIEEFKEPLHEDCEIPPVIIVKLCKQKLY